LDEDLQETSSVLVPMVVNNQRIYLSVQKIGETRHGLNEEGEIASRPPTLDKVLDGLTGFAQEMATRLQGTDASKVSVEFGCEFALESGTFVAVIGKASARSTFKVALEWTKQVP
jgi:hypothetical protein